MELTGLTAYASEKYQIREEHKCADDQLLLADDYIEELKGILGGTSNG